MLDLLHSRIIAKTSRYMYMYLEQRNKPQFIQLKRYLEHSSKNFLHYKSSTCTCTYTYMYMQGCGNTEPTAGHFDLYSPLLSCSSYTLYTTQFQFTGHSLYLSDNVLYDWLFPHHCVHVCTGTYICTYMYMYMNTC